MFWRRILITIFCVSLFACGGNSYNSTIPDTNAEGVWLGTYTSTSGRQFSSTALITSTGITGIDFGNGVYFYGTTAVSNGNVTITGNESESTSMLVTIGATVALHQTISLQVLNGAYAIQTGDAIDAGYDSIYERDSLVSKVVATWSGQNVFGGGTLNWTLHIASNGTFTGSADNFALNGTINPIDSNKNEYAVTMTVNDPKTNYLMNGNYTGIATLLDTTATDSNLMLFFKGDQQDKVLGKLLLQRSAP
jgi:hypothetical protein